MSAELRDGDALARLAEVDPGPGRVEGWTLDVDRLLARAVTPEREEPSPGSSGIGPKARLNRRRVAFGSALGSVAVLVAFALITGPEAPEQDSFSEGFPRPAGDPTEPRFPSPVAALSTAAAEASPGTPARGQSPAIPYVHLRVRDSSLVGAGTVTSGGGGLNSGPRYVAYEDRETETWFRPNGSSFIRGASQGGYPSPEDRDLGEAERESGVATPFAPPSEFESEVPKRSTATADRLGFYLLKPKDKRLPRDPGKLAELFASVKSDSTSGGAGDPSPRGDAVQTFDYASRLLLEAPYDRELRAAAFEVVANLDLVELEERTRDPLGRLGTAVTFEAVIDEVRGGGTPLSRYSLIFDADTSEPLAYVKEQLDAPSDTGSPVIDYTVLVDSGEVGEVGVRPG